MYKDEAAYAEEEVDGDPAAEAAAATAAADAEAAAEAAADALAPAIFASTPPNADASGAKAVLAGEVRYAEKEGREIPFPLFAGS